MSPNYTLFLICYLIAKMPTVYTDISFNKNYKPSFSMTVGMSKFNHVKYDDDIHLLTTSHPKGY